MSQNLRMGVIGVAGRGGLASHAHKPLQTAVWLSLIAMSLAGRATAAPAASGITEVSYSYQSDRPNHPDAKDPEQVVLTDGKTHPGAWNLGGWAAVLREQGSPLTIRFNLGRRLDLASVTLHYLDDWDAGITAPTRVQLRFSIPGADVAPPVSLTELPASDARLQSVTIPVQDVSARFVEVTVLNWGGGWTFLSEVSFEAVPGSLGQERGR